MTTKLDEICDGSGPDGADVPCGARHRRDGSSWAEERDDHACADCGHYVCGADTHDGGLCPECAPL